MDVKIDYSDVLREFLNKKVKFVVVGGFAAVAHGVVRVTMDMDLAIQLDSNTLNEAWEIMKRFGFLPRQPVTREQFTDPLQLLSLSQEKDAKAISFYHQKQPYLVLDFLFSEEFQLLQSDVMLIELFGFNCPIITIDKLIELKRKAGRSKDLEDINALEEIRKK